MKAIYVIKNPIETEKVMKLQDKNVYGFYIDRKATKVDVKMAIQELYGREVESVRIVSLPAKDRQVGRRTIQKRSERKKALVKLKGDKKLDVNKVKDTSK